MLARAVVLVVLLAGTRDALAQHLRLELRPRAGDTLRMRLDQTTEMSYARTGALTRRVVTTLTMVSRAIVESNLPASALILAITDSVAVTTSDEHARALVEEARRQLEGRRMRLRLSPDGTVGVADQATPVPKEVSDLVSVMPASFPREMVAVGSTWMREMFIPPSANLGVRAPQVVRARFRLDSATARGDLAYVSMRGDIQDSGTGAYEAAAERLSGTVTGSMVIDRRRGWLSESRFQVQMRTTVTSTDAAGKATPLQFRMTITQHMRVMDAP